MEPKEPEALLSGQANMLKYILSFADSMALKCVVQLHVADIIHSHDSPITLSQIASSIATSDHSTSPDISYLARIMRLLVRRNIFAAHQPSDGGETLYGMTHSSRWLLRDSELSLAPMILAVLHPWLLDPWHRFSECVKEGGIAFEKAHGKDIWDFALENLEFNQMFNTGMASSSKMVMKAVLSEYKDGFDSVESVVDVGGGVGAAVAEIVKTLPHIKAINFDLPHVVSAAPVYDGVTHVGGDMFEVIPKADAVFMKWVMHDWDDKKCVKILQNCRKAIPEKTGKVVIVELVLKTEGEGTFNDIGLYSDLLMIAHSSGGRERTEKEWKKILEEAAFPRYRVISLPALTSIIEAHPL